MSFSPRQLHTTVIVGDGALVDAIVMSADRLLRVAVGTLLARERGTDMVGQASSESSGSAHAAPQRSNRCRAGRGTARVPPPREWVVVAPSMESVIGTVAPSWHPGTLAR